MEILQWIQQWYKQQCDGDWEHSNGIKIESLDNPGWQIKIDLEGTVLEGDEIEYNLVEQDPIDWYGLKIEKNVFHAACDPNKLSVLLEKFRELILTKKT